ncbi:MAG: sigma-70 family RNA polymerase sigma factor [Planctomycetes bacterium]|nr:sigma-70 family RNA polymerase sigma factor [Planctomycetota bacterium]
MSIDPERQARFVELLHAHQGVVRKVAALYARDRADRQDLCQEIALQLWRSFDCFRGESAFSTFAYRVALNTAWMRLRRAYRRPDPPSDAELATLAAPSADHDDAEVERLYAAIRELAPLDRALVLLVLDEKSHAEIAAVTGLTTGNVSVRLVRCRERLRKSLQSGRDAGRGTPCSTRT